MFPPRFTISSDGNVLEFIREVIPKDKKDNIPLAEYKYIKSKTKKGMTVTLNQNQIDTLTQKGYNTNDNNFHKL